MNSETVTKHFYTRFIHERLAFLSTLDGISSYEERERYASFLLTRLLFLYFLQQRGILDGDTSYLAHHLQLSQEQHTNFYQAFLLPFFEDGISSLASPLSRSHFGAIPALDAHLFKDPIQATRSLSIPDEAFLRLFTFLDTYTWSLSDEQPQHKREITPAILGYILEQYINQQQVGAYYTKDDVTLYIASNTIIPALFDALYHVHPEIGSSIDIDDLITQNADLSSIARHYIQTCHEYLFTSCYASLQRLTILDPTCGSGAFLLAALHILEPLYLACLTRLHLPHERYAIRRAIITNNLFGVDMLPEVADICCLRLLLCSLVPIQHTDEITPLPALYANIHVGNILIGYTKNNEPNILPRLTYNRQLASEYAFDVENRIAFERWRTAHSPLQWPLVFSEVMQHGGFDVIIGNPPYVEYEENVFPYQVYGYETQPCANLYPYVIERSHELLASGGRHGMIVPLSAFATRNMTPFIECFLRWFPYTWVSFYHFRPTMLFSGGKVASIPTAIYLARKAQEDTHNANKILDESSIQSGIIDHGYRESTAEQQRYSTHLLKWFVSQRPHLFSSFAYTQVKVPRDPDNLHYYPKLGNPLENSILQKVLAHRLVRDYLSPVQNTNTMFYRSAGGLYWKVFVNFPWPYVAKTNKRCSFQESFDRDVFVALFNSSLFWWYYTVTFDTFNLKDYMLFGFRFTYPNDTAIVSELVECCQRLMKDFQQHARHLKRGSADSYTLYARKSKLLIDEIDRVLARHYGFTDEESGFILGYDKVYRMGQES